MSIVDPYSRLYLFEHALDLGMSWESARAYAREWREYLEMDASDRLWREWEAVESIEAADFNQANVSHMLETFPDFPDEEFLKIADENAERWKDALELLAK